MTRKSSFALLLLSALVLGIFIPEARASWLSDLTGVDVNVSAGTVSVDPPTIEEIPGRIQRAVETLPAAIEGAVRDIFNPAGAALAAAIRHAQAQARHGAQPMPAQIRSEFEGIIPSHVLNDVTWNSLDKNRIDLANLTLLHNENTAAMTLGNVIVFDRLEGANQDLWLWAHELLHTIQYSGMGIELFAHNYVVSSGDMENQADEYANMVVQKIKERRQGGHPSPIQHAQSATVSNSAGYFQQYQAAVKQYAPATACLDIRDNGGYPSVTNVCNVPVWVSDYIEVDRQSGQQIRGRCTPGPGIVCEIMPGTTLPVYTPRRGCVQAVRFGFFGGGGGNQDSIWEGDCSGAVGRYGGGGQYQPRQPQQQMGNSCCMFNGNRCGPFPQSGPLGTPCSCQYGNPYANGQVCN